MSGLATVGWCPGVLRPMASGDGLVLRVKPRGGRLSLDQAAAIASLAWRFGNGQLDLTGRANLQIRGVAPEMQALLTAGLRDAGLLDPDAASEALRNIVASPLAGCDPTAFDVAPFLSRLETCLATEPGLRGLPAKWSFVVDGGGRIPLTRVPADVRFCFAPDGGVRIGLAEAWSEPLATLPDLRRLLLDIAMLVAVQPEPCRMAALLDREGTDTVFARLGLPLADAPPCEPQPVTAVDLLALDDPVAVAPAFGSLRAETLSEAVAACRDHGVADLRLTPWRILIATAAKDVSALHGALSALGLIRDPGDPRLHVTACVGAPACHRATVPARSDAAYVARTIDPARTGPVHVSACAKGCARPPDAAWTLVAREGNYDILRDRDAAPHVTGLSSTEAANWLSRAGGARIL